MATPLAQLQALEQTVRGFYGRGDYQKALVVMPKVMAWADGSLPRLHHYRARSLAWIGLMISKVGRC